MLSVREIIADQYNHKGINDAIGTRGETIVIEPLESFLVECSQ